jgi:hypothetical protein
MKMARKQPLLTVICMIKPRRALKNNFVKLAIRISTRFPKRAAEVQRILELNISQLSEVNRHINARERKIAE